jgi:endonuclease/exonuclease/phosphatase family metal-dependent hydrolase
VLFWFIFDAKYSLISVFSILVGLGFLGSYVQLKGEPAPEGGTRICSYNVKYFVGEGVSPKIATVEEIVDYLQRGKFDIICLQEANITSRNIRMEAIKNKLGNINRMQVIRSGRTGGPVTYTRYPVSATGEIRYEGTSNMVLFTDLIIQKDTFRVYNCHLQSNRLQPHELNSIDSLRFSNKPEDYSKVRKVGSKLKQAFVKRAEQAQILHGHIRDCPYPVIVCGDFNDTPVSYSYKKVKGNMKDAFVESGHGIGNTYNGRLPSFRIDYILHDPIFTSYGFKTGRGELSDHFPVHCVLALKKEQ